MVTKNNSDNINSNNSNIKNSSINKSKRTKEVIYEHSNWENWLKLYF